MRITILYENKIRLAQYQRLLREQRFNQAKARPTAAWVLADVKTNHLPPNRGRVFGIERHDKP